MYVLSNDVNNTLKLFCKRKIKKSKLDDSYKLCLCFFFNNKICKNKNMSILQTSVDIKLVIKY